MTTPDTIIKTVADYYHITVEDLKKRCRKNEIKEARFVAIYFIRKYTYMPLAKIGAYVSSGTPFGHDTVINAITKVNNYIATDQHFRGVINDLLNTFEESKEGNDESVFQETDFFPCEKTFKNKFKDIAPVNGNGYSGYRSHSL